MGAALKLVLAETDMPAAAPIAAPARSLLRFITCGSVDDGKSTLLGRLLFETGSVFEDQQEALEKDSRRFGTTGGEPDYALLVDGLAAEREQGITIDVAYRYFATPRRAYIAADTPGHEQYTRNMATGASTADVAIILVDARKGLLPQTKRHSYIVSMLGVKRVIVAVNKMDLVDYDEATFRAIEEAYQALARSLGFAEAFVLPLSAVKGDNVTGPSARTPWYRGPALLHLIETIEPGSRGDLAFRMPVQWVNRPNLDFRGFAGTLASGSIRVGEAITVLPRGQNSTIARIVTADGDLEEAVAGQSVTLTLADEIDVSRGDVIIRRSGQGFAGQDKALSTLNARVLALQSQGLAPGRAYLARIGTQLVAARIALLHHAVNINDYAQAPAAELAMNGIGLVTLRFETPVAATTYAASGDLGSLILIDPTTNETIGLGVIDTLAQPEAEAARPETAADKLRPLLVKAGLAPDGADDVTILRIASWRAFSALATAVVVLVLTGSIGWATVALVADFVARPLLKILHARAFNSIADRRAEADRFGIDGGGI